MKKFIIVLFTALVAFVSCDLFSADEPEVEVPVIEEPILDLIPEINVPYTGKIVNIDVQYSGEYSIEIEESAKSWITLVDTKVVQTDSLQFEISANDTDKSRKGRVTFKTEQVNSSSMSFIYFSQGPKPQKYCIKAFESSVLESIFNPFSVICDDKDSVGAELWFEAENDYDMMQLVAKIPADIPYEIYKNGKLIASDKDITQATAGSDDSNGHFSLGIRSLGTNYSTYAGFYASTSPAWANPWDVTKAEGALGEPLTSLWIANNYWSGGDTQDNAKMTRQWYCNTSDLNSDCGFRSYYSVLYFGGRKHESVADLIWTSIASWDAQYGRDKFETYGCPPELGRTTIGGIRLVSGDSNPATTIVDPEGITWKKVGVYFDGEVDTVDDKYYPSENWKGELNRGAKGDYLWLYYTTESSKTGRKLMITNPLFMKYYNTIVNNGGSYAIAEGCLGTLLTWTSGTWCVHTNEILNDLADQVAESSSTLAKAFRPGSTQRVDFIQLYDKDMKPYVYKGVTDYPANFNRNARGDDEIFISYNFITPDDAEWSKF